MMNYNNLKNKIMNNIIELTKNETLIINGGHDGPIYELGRGFCKALKFCAIVASIFLFKR